jgi:UDP-glucose 4-epimerase
LTSSPGFGKAEQASKGAVMDKHVLVTGGAGYIGSHACKVLAEAGFVPVAFDNLSTGWEQAVQFGPFARGDLLDRASIDRAFSQYRPIAVMHFAALSLVGESMKDPGRYWRENVNGALNLVEAAVAAGCLNFVFSSIRTACFWTRIPSSIRSTPMAPRRRPLKKSCGILAKVTD